jgi:hypothetical protein
VGEPHRSHGSIFHADHKGDEIFPTRAEMAMARDAARPRVLLLNWKIAYGSSWAKVAKGEQDARIDRFAARIKTSFPERFFLVLNHEPENDVIAKGGSGWEAKDFAAMYRLGVDQRRSRLPVPVLNVLADLFTQVVVHPVQGAVGGPGLEVVVDQFRVREVRGQGIPLAAGPVEVADRVHDVAAGVYRQGWAFGVRAAG